MKPGENNLFPPNIRAEKIKRITESFIMSSDYFTLVQMAVLPINEIPMYPRTFSLLPSIVM